MASNHENQLPESTNFVIKITLTGCSPYLQLDPLEDIIVSNGEAEEVIIAGASNGDCRFELELVDTQTGAAADSSVFTLT